MQTLKYASIKKSSIYKTSNEEKYTINKRFAGRQIVKKIYSYLFDVSQYRINRMWNTSMWNTSSSVSSHRT
jgi:hypothetical protein